MATLVLAVATCVDAIAFPLAVIFVLYYMGCKVLGYSGHCCKLMKVLLIAAWSLMLLFVAYFTSAMWQPYNLHCLPRLNRSDWLAPWCTDAWPNAHWSARSRYAELAWR